MPLRTETAKALLSPVVLVSALGYFVDVFDIILFSVVRIPSLKSLGLSDEEITRDGVFLINVQMIGMLLGGVLWGVLGDKLGRVKVLFGSILLYSLANLANAFVQTVDGYAFWRLLAGIGLAGEIGAGITLVAEVLPQSIRGYGTTIVATVGVFGALIAGLVGDYVDWRWAYAAGGLMGFLLLILRVSVHESGLFSEVKSTGIRKGDLAMLFGSWRRLGRYLACILVGLPTWFVVGIAATFSPEICKALGAPESPRVGLAIIWCYTGLFLGDLIGGVWSQKLASRKKVLGIFVVGGAASSAIYLSLSSPSLNVVYPVLLLMGFFAGFWVLTLTTAAEQFGTNLRATVTTTVPNFIRGALVPMTLLFSSLKGDVGAVGSAAVVGAIVYAISFLALLSLEETFHRNLNYLEE